MKAKIKGSNTIIDVEPYSLGSYISKLGVHPKNDLEFIEEVTIEGWLCKNEYEDGFARIHTEEPCPSLDEMPITGEQIGIWRSNGNIYIISDELFPDLKWTDSPKRVKITITPME